MKRLWPALKWILIVWGAVSFVGVLIVGVMVARRFNDPDSILGSSNTSSSARASKEDVRFVLNWCRLGDDRIEEVVHSYESARSFTGDHLDAHAIRISRVTTDELKQDDFSAVAGSVAIRFRAF
jgi:cytoskeletal protein RodZ